MKGWIVVAAFALGGCVSMTPATYMVSADSKAALQKYQGSKVLVTEIGNPPTFDPMCRAVGNVTIDGGLSPGQFVAKGFNDELRFAGLHAEGGARLKGRLNKVAFSSSSGITGGWWDMDLALESSNGASMSVQHKYEFDAGFVGASACNNASRAFGPAVQQLVQKTIADPRFGGLIR